MRRIICMLMVVVSATLFAGCSAGPLYAPARGDSGYSEAEIAPGRWLVVFQGRRKTSAGTAFELAKVRAAEIALRADKSAFRIASFANGERQYLDFDPGSVHSRSYRDADGDFHYYDAVGRSPSLDQYLVPIARITVDLLDEADDMSFAATGIIESAVARGLVRPEDVGLGAVE